MIIRQLLLGLTVFLTLIVSHGRAQITFQKIIGNGNNEVGHCVQQTLDTGYIISGQTSVVSVYLIKTNSFADIVWTKTFKSPNSRSARSVQQTIDKGYILTAESYGTGDVFLIKTDENGDTLWTREIGSSYADDGFSVYQTKDSGYIVCGRTSYGLPFVNGKTSTHDVYLVKINSIGDVLWKRVFGGRGYDYGYSVQQTIDSGYIIAGSSSSFGGNILGARKVYLIKTDVDGNLLWSKLYTSMVPDAEAKSVQQTFDNGFIIAGSLIEDTINPRRMLLIKTGSNGDILWTKSYGSVLGAVGESVKQTRDSGFIITGSVYNPIDTFPNLYVVKTNSIGDTLWTRVFRRKGHETFGRSIHQTYDDGFIIAGSTNQRYDSSYIYLVKTDKDGNSTCNETSLATSVHSLLLQTLIPATEDSTVGYLHYSLTTIGSAGTARSFCSYVDILEIPNTSISIIFSPNPFTAHTNLQTEKFFKNATLTVYNLYGQTVKQMKNISGQTVTLHRDNLPSGLYFVRISHENKTISAGKFVITDN